MTLSAATAKVPHTCSTSTLESQISLHFALQLAISKIHVQQTQAPKFSVFTLQAISLYGQPFSPYRPLGQLHWMTPKWPLKTKRSKVYAYNHNPRLPNFTPFHSIASCFQVTGKFETSALTNSKMTLKTKKSKQGWTLTYFETCPVGQVMVIFNCPKWKFTCLAHMLSSTHYQYFLFLQLLLV